MQVTIVLTDYQAKQGTNARGAWTLHIFKDSSGQDYTTFDAATASALLGKVGTGQPVSLIYKSGGVDQWGEKRTIEHVVPDTAPGAPQQAQVPAPQVHVSPPQTTATVSSAVVTPDQRETKIAWANAGNIAAALIVPLVESGLTENVIPGWKRLQWDIYQHMIRGPQAPDEGIQFGEPAAAGASAGHDRTIGTDGFPVGY